MQLPTAEGLQFGAEIPDEVLDQARTAGGELGNEDRESGSGMTCPVYAVVGNNSQDAKYTEQQNGKTIKRDRSGEFKKIKDGETTFLGTDQIHPLVILSCRTGRVCFEDGKSICRGISTNGRYDEVCISPNTPIPGQGLGISCSRCPMNRFNPEYRNDKGASAINPRTNAPFEDNEWCKSSCDIYAAKLDSENDLEMELSKVQFSSLGFPNWTQFARMVENRKAKLWSFWAGIKAEETPNKDPGRSPSYLPRFAIGGILRPEQIEKAEELRRQLISQLEGLLRNHTALPPQLVEEPAGDAALPAGEDAGIWARD